MKAEFEDGATTVCHDDTQTRIHTQSENNTIITAAAGNNGCSPFTVGVPVTKPCAYWPVGTPTAEWNRAIVWVISHICAFHAIIRHEKGLYFH